MTNFPLYRCDDCGKLDTHYKESSVFCYGCKSENMTQQSEKDRKQFEVDDAKNTLIDLLSDSPVVYTTVRSVSSSGMSRTMSAYSVSDGDIRNITHLISKACDMRYNRKSNTISIRGCGMDMGFHLVNCLSYALHGYDCENSGYTIEQRWL